MPDLRIGIEGFRISLVPLRFETKTPPAVLSAAQIHDTSAEPH